MNSARRLIESSSSFWKELAPMLPNYVKHVNMGGYDRYDPPIRRDTNRARHFLINELAFKCFASGAAPSEPAAETIYEGLQAKWRTRLPSNTAIEDSLSNLERNELSELVSRLAIYKRSIDDSPAEFEKVVPAFGRLENIEIDILTDKSIFEVKAGERPFRSIDFRQLILAAAVLKSPRPKIVLINPREGVIWTDSLADFVETVCLRSMSELVPEIHFYLSDSGISA